MPRCSIHAPTATNQRLLDNFDAGVLDFFFGLLDVTAIGKQNRLAWLGERHHHRCIRASEAGQIAHVRRVNNQNCLDCGRVGFERER